MGAQAVTLAVLLLFTATVNADDPKEKVTFEKDHFTMTCPQAGTWSKDEMVKTKRIEYTGKTKGLYHCEYDLTKDNSTKYYFYVKGKACADCFEMPPKYLACAIVADVVATTCVMMMVFRCTKKKSSAASKAPVRPGGRPAPSRPPPVQSPSSQSPYQALNPHTRSNDVYSKTG